MLLRADPIRREGVVRRALALAIAACLSTGAGVPPAANAATPFDSRRATVIPQGEIDNWTVTVDRFSSQLAPESALRETRRQWRASGRPLTEARSGEWHILSRLEGDRIRTLQLRVAPGGGSEGFDSTWRRHEVGPSMLRDVVPAGATILGATASVDGTRRGETLVAEVPSDPATTRFRTVEALARIGFAPVAFPGMPAQDPSARLVVGWRSSNGASELLVFRRADAELVVTVTPGRRPGWTSWVAHGTGVLQ